jgi:hypothetical protein
MTRFFKKVLPVSIAVLSAAVLLSPFWPTALERGFFLSISIRLLLISATVYGTLAFAEIIHDRWKSGML